MRRGMEMPTFPIYYHRARLPLAEEVEEVQNMVLNSGAELLLIDSLAAASGGESNELKGSQGALLFNSAIRKIKTADGFPITSLIIGQTSKSIDNPGKKTVYGSVMFTYYARNIFELCRGDDEDTDVVHLGLFHRECNLDRKSSPLGFRLNYNDTDRSMNIEREPLNISEFIQKVTTASRILDILKRGPATTKELAEAMDMKDKISSVSVILQRLKKREKVLMTGEKWGLIDHH